MIRWCIFWPYTQVLRTFTTDFVWKFRGLCFFREEVKIFFRRKLSKPIFCIMPCHFILYWRDTKNKLWYSSYNHHRPLKNYLLPKISFFFLTQFTSCFCGTKFKCLGTLGTLESNFKLLSDISRKGLLKTRKEC